MRAKPSRPSSSFETRARAFEFAKRLGIRAPQDEDEHRVLQSSPYKQPFPLPWHALAGPIPVFSCFSADSESSISGLTISSTRTPPRSRGAFLRPGFCIVASPTPNRGVGGAPRVVRVQRHPLGLHMTRQARRLARRLASHNAGRSPLGAPPWRFWAPGAALPSPSAPAVLQRRAVALRIRAASSSQPGRSAWRAGSLPPEASGYEPPPQDATPRSAFRIVSGDAPR